MKENKFGEKYNGDSRFVADCRKLQSIYRVEIDEKIRPYTDKNGNVHYYGNYINNGDIIDKENCWKNFLTENAFNYAKYRVDNKQKRETIESDRLFNNLLSSQPMAFNLFCPLRQMLEESPETATKTIKVAFPGYPIHRVTGVDLEFIPENYMELTGEKSAMDAIIRFEDRFSKKGFIAIETKYSENLGTNVASKREKAIEATKRLKCFKPDVQEQITENGKGLTQIYRNFLMSEMYGLYGEEEELQSYSIILSPTKHPSTDKELKTLHNELREEYQHKIKSITLEDFVEKIISVCPKAYKSIFERFYDRYLNFDKLNNID